MSQAGSVNSPDQPNSLRNDNHLAWVDMEMTGLDPMSDRIIEVAIVITDSNLNMVAEGPVIAVHQSDEVLAGMDDWNTKTHGKSGLIDRVKQSAITEEQAEAMILDWMSQYVGPNKTPMCGNSICQDRRFMARYMPKLEAYFHYRNLDVSTLKELAKRWSPVTSKKFTKKTKHTALSDILESVDELRFYKEHFIKDAE